MDVIHFTPDAADPLNAFSARGARFLPLADGYGDSHLRCLHLQCGAALHTPSITHAAALLVVHGRINVITQFPFSNIQLHAGMGAIFADNEPYEMRVRSEGSGKLQIRRTCRSLSWRMPIMVAQRRSQKDFG